MLPQSHFTAFNDIKSKHFSNALRDSSVYINSCIRQPVNQELDKFHVLVFMHAYFVDLVRESVSKSKVATRLWLNVCWCASEAYKYEKRNHNDGYDDSLLNCNIGWKKHTADLALITSRFSQTLLQESFTSDRWLSFKVETWRFTKNKLLKLVNSMKVDFLFAGLNLNRIIQKKKCQKRHILWTML